MTEAEELSKVKEDLQVLNVKFNHLLDKLQLYFTSQYELNEASIRKNEADQKHHQVISEFTQDITLVLALLSKRVVELEQKVQ